jgi:hypothetical protein
MVILAFGKLYEELYDQISRVNKVPGYDKSGHELLTQNRAVVLVRQQIEGELNKQAIIP